MADIVSPEVRSKMMSRISGKNTKPELLMRKALFARGLRYRLHDRSLAGKPDMVFRSKNAILFIHGCFWHGHDCHLFKFPEMRKDFWQEKISGNTSRDVRAYALLLEQGWRVGIIWECALKGKTSLPFDVVISRCSSWLVGKEKYMEINGFK